MTKELKEFQADGENSSIADPIDKNPGSRRADVFKSANPTADSVEDLEGQNKGEKLIGKVKTAQAPARKADKRSMKEHVTELFDGSDLSEEFKEKAATIFEAAVIERVNEEVAALEEEFEVKLSESIDSLVEKMDDYLDHIVENWLEENELAIESTTKVAVAESFMDGLKELFNEHNVELPEGGVDVLESLEERIAELENELNESEAANIELSKLIREASEGEVLDEISEGLTETQKDRLASLAENVEYDSMEQFRSKMETIKESFVNKKSANAEEVLNEEFEDDTAKTTETVDPTMAAYLNAISRTQRK